MKSLIATQIWFDSQDWEKYSLCVHGKNVIGQYNVKEHATTNNVKKTLQKNAMTGSVNYKFAAATKQELVVLAYFFSSIVELQATNVNE